MKSLYKPSQWLILVVLAVTIPTATAAPTNLNSIDGNQVNTADIRTVTPHNRSASPIIGMGPDGAPGMGPPPGPPGGPPGMPGGPPGMGLMLPLHEVDLTDDQVDKLVHLKNSLMDKVGPKMGKIHSLERELRNALCQSTVNAADVAAISSQISAEKQTLDGLFTENAISQAQVLTPEQRQKIKSEMNRRELGPPHSHHHESEHH